MASKVTDVEQIKKQVRKMAAGRVLVGDSADVHLDLGHAGTCPVRVAAGYGPLSKAPEPLLHDRLIWILDGFVEISSASGGVLTVSQGESIVLRGSTAYRLVFPQLTIYLSVEGGDAS
jgi:hypothetical protein